MNSDKHNLTDEQLAVIYAHFCHSLLSASLAHKVAPGLLFGRRRLPNTHEITVARDTLVRHMHESTRLYIDSHGDTQVEALPFGADVSLPPAAEHTDWCCISARRLAQVIGVNHATILGSLARTGPCNRKERKQ